MEGEGRGVQGGVIEISPPIQKNAPHGRHKISESQTAIFNGIQSTINQDRSDNRKTVQTFISGRINNNKKQQIGFWGPGGGPLDPDRDLVTIPGSFSSRAETATRLRPKMIFRVVWKKEVLKDARAMPRTMTCKSHEQVN